MWQFGGARLESGSIVRRPGIGLLTCWLIPIAGKRCGFARAVRCGCCPERIMSNPCLPICQVMRSLVLGKISQWKRSSFMPCGFEETRLAAQPSLKIRKDRISSKLEVSWRWMVQSSRLTITTLDSGFERQYGAIA